MSEWVAVVSDEGEEPIEIPTESDGTMLLSTLAAQFPKVIGLKFRNPETNLLRGVRCHDDRLFPPNENEGWGNHAYIVCTMPGDKGFKSKKEDAALKRKSENDPGGMSSKNQRVDEHGDNIADESDDSDDKMDEQSSAASSSQAVCDLIVLGLPWKATGQDIKDYFAPYGELSMVQLKRSQNGQSKGFAFIRFKDVEVQNKVVLTRHMIMDRWCDVKVPESQELKNSKAAASCKIFVARISESITQEDLKEHFEIFGTVTDVYIPKPFRAFAFVTFLESRVAQSLFGKDHVMKGVSVHIGSAQPRSSKGGMGSGGGRGDDRGYGGRGGYDGGGYGGGGNYGGVGQGGYHNPWAVGPGSGPDGYRGGPDNYRRGSQRGYY